eukprot:TRINITY_DN7059_c0_g1_i1.p1 TRINITY_DN7059_c0_g1~~TRINITY_DN7059_c0_g1_i1.p1  ORF type:complete len:320 (+),score=97.90 TRINITY_DN7059_c0_g1_i1:137-1096(+)
MPDVSTFLFDPTGLFTIGCLLVGPILAYMEDPTTAFPKILNYFKDPAMLAGYIAFGATLFFVGKWKKSLSQGEVRTALWFLFNGAFIHITMDGLTGGHHFLDLLNNHYIQLDKRFLEDEATSWLITQIELFIEAPLCLYAFATVVKRYPSREVFTILASFLQLWGAVIFFFTEIINDFVNVPVDRNLEFTFDHCLYFWFGFGANLLWIAVPSWLIYDACVTVTARFASDQEDDSDSDSEEEEEEEEEEENVRSPAPKSPRRSPSKKSPVANKTPVKKTPVKKTPVKRTPAKAKKAAVVETPRSRSTRYGTRRSMAVAGN